MFRKALCCVVVGLLAVGFLSCIDAQDSSAKNIACGRDKNDVQWDWGTDMQLTTNPPLPGLGGVVNPYHMQKIEIRVVSKNAIKIERAKITFNATGWDPTITQNGTFYLNETSETNWYIVLSNISYLYTQPWDNQVLPEPYNFTLLVTAGTIVKWNVSVCNQGQVPTEISSPVYTYMVEGAWYRDYTELNDTEIFDNNIHVSFYPAHPMVYDTVTITISVKNPSPGRVIKPMIYRAIIHVEIKFNDPYKTDITDMQLEAEPLHPNKSYQKTAEINGTYSYKTNIQVKFWIEAWQEPGMGSLHISSYPEVWEYNTPNTTVDEFSGGLVFSFVLLIVITVSVFIKYRK